MLSLPVCLLPFQKVWVIWEKTKTVTRVSTPQKAEQTTLREKANPTAPQLWGLRVAVSSGAQRSIHFETSFEGPKSSQTYQAAEAMAPHPAKAQSVTSYHPVLGLRYFEPKSLIQGLAHCGKCSSTSQVWHPSSFAVSPAPFCDQGRKSQGEVTTVSPGFDKDACSHRLSAGSWLGVAYLSGSTTPSMSHWFPYLPLDFGQRSVLQPPGWGGAVYEDHYTLGQAPTWRERHARSPSRIQVSLLCSESGNCTPVVPVASENLVLPALEPTWVPSQSNQSMPVCNEGFSPHSLAREGTGWVSNGPIYTWSPDTAAQCWHRSARSWGDIAAFCPCTAGNSPGRKGHPVTAQAPSALTGKAEQNHHMAGLLLLRLRTGRWLPGQPPANGNLGPKP